MIQSVNLIRKPLAARAAWAELRDAIECGTGWSGDTLVVRYVESTSSCEMRERPWKECGPPPDGWEGRWFTREAEVRWIAVADGTFDAWLVTEGDGGVNLKAEDRRYYLLGRGSRASDGSSGHATFREARYGQTIFEYPVTGSGSDSRAYVLVRLYRALAPTDWPEGIDETEDVIDGSMLVEHRFVNLVIDDGKGA